jgi:hypothetical protein
LNAEREVAKEDEGIRVGMIQLIPDEFAFVCAKEVRDKRRLSGAGIRGDECERILEIAQ